MNAFVEHALYATVRNLFRLFTAVVLVSLTLMPLESRSDARGTSSSTTTKVAESVHDISESDFTSLVLNSSKPVLVDFYAGWCYPCKKLAPLVSDVSREYKDRVSFYRVDVDKNSTLASRYQIEGIPALKVFKNGKIVEESLGLQSSKQISSLLNHALSAR
ncbi:MAG TPA: thioredoxin [Planktothrix sp.]|jgi:thioredoxin 1